MGAGVVGVTDFCLYPTAQVAALPKVGGTKNVNREAVLALTPDLILANQEENTQADIEFFQAQGLEVLLQFPHTMRQALDDLWTLIRRFDRPLVGQSLVTLEKMYEWTSAAAIGKSVSPRVFCPIWREDDWWMTINGATYVSDVITVCGGVNVFAERERRYPLAADLDVTQPAKESLGDTRYPRVTLPEILATQPEVILLPTEPYEFKEGDLEFWRQFTALPAVQNNRVHLVDGSWLTWHGVRCAVALRELPSLLE